MAACTSPSLAAPSPKYVTVTCREDSKSQMLADKSRDYNERLAANILQSVLIYLCGRGCIVYHPYLRRKVCKIFSERGGQVLTRPFEPEDQSIK